MKSGKFQVIKIKDNRYKIINESFVIEIIDEKIVFIGVAVGYNDEIISTTKEQARKIGLIV